MLNQKKNNSPARMGRIPSLHRSLCLLLPAVVTALFSLASCTEAFYAAAGSAGKGGGSGSGLALLGLLGGGGLGGNGGGGNGGSVSAISYPVSSYSIVQNAPVTNITPTVTGTVTNCTSSPALPSGLTLSTTTCAITGTPTASQGSTAYTITATNSGTNATAGISITITVTGSAPGVTYTGTPYALGLASITLQPTLTGTTPNNCTSSPTLPAGLIINPVSCVISGTPAGTQSRTGYTITATNAYGIVSPGISIAILNYNVTATRVYGQLGNFTTGTANNGGISANSQNTPRGVAVDSAGNLYVADGSNNRVLYFPSGSTTATRVYGQGGNFTTGTANNGGISANSLNAPSGIAADSSGNLYVADIINNRVLYFPSGSTTATRVYGQGGNFTTGTPDNGGISANSLNGPWAVAVDSSGNLYVADSMNNRVLYFPSGSTTATRVYGQGGNFTTGTSNNGGISANSLAHPFSVAVDSSGNLYVGDYVNNRVLYYPAGSTTATRVYGQGGNFTTGTTNNGGISANSLNGLYGVAVDSAGNLYVADGSNNRVLYFPSGSTTATRVYGQCGAFAAAASGTSASSLNLPLGVAVDSSGNLYVADLSNNRVLYIGP